MRAIKFFKENSYNMVKVFINQIGITIFSFVLYFSIASFKENNIQLYHKLMIAISAFAMLFFFVLLYTAAWDLGASDKIRIESKKAEKNIFKGALITLCANTVNFLLAGIVLIGVAFKLTGAFAAVSGVCYTIFILLNGMYNGVIRNGLMLVNSTEEPHALLSSIGFLVILILPIIASHIGYVFGLKNIRIFKSSPKKKTK